MAAGDKLLALFLVLSLIISSAIPAVCGFPDFPESPSGGAGGVFTGEFPTGEGTQPESPFVTGFRRDSRGGGGLQPVAHWIFQSAYYSGGAWQDQSGNGYHATASQAPSYDVGGDWLLNGVDDYASPGDALDSVWTGASGWTVEIKLKPAAGGGSTQALLLKDAYPITRSFWIRLDDFKPRVRWYDGGRYSDTAAFPTLSAGTTYILRVTYDPTQSVGSRVTFYLDGSDDTGGNTLSGSPVEISDSDIHLGFGERLDTSGSPTSSIPFKGSFEYLKIWDEVLPP
jgi:hypothetical protein